MRDPRDPMRPPPARFLSGWRGRGIQLANAIAEHDPAFKEKLQHARARRNEVLKKLEFAQRLRPDLMEKLDEYDGIAIARRGLDPRKG